MFPTIQIYLRSTEFVHTIVSRVSNLGKNGILNDFENFTLELKKISDQYDEAGSKCRYKYFEPRMVKTIIKFHK